MNKLEMTEIENKRVVNKLKDYLFDEKTYDILNSNYHWLLFLGGVFLLAAIHKLSWLYGISWFFLSDFIALIIVRLDITINGPKIIELNKLRLNNFSWIWKSLN